MLHNGQWIVFLAQAERAPSSGGSGGVIFLVVFGLGIAAVVFFILRRNKQRAESQSRAAELGWTYTGGEAWEKTEGARNKVNYTYSGTTNGIPWVYAYSTKYTRRETLSAGDSALREGGITIGGGTTSTMDSRSDWRTNDARAPHVVFLMPRATSPKLIGYKKFGPDRLASLVLNPGITEGDTEKGTRVNLEFGGMSFNALSNPLGNLPELNFGLHEIESRDDDTFTVYAPDEAAAREVLNPSARAALDAWNAAFKARFPNATAGYAHRHPFIVFHPSGIYMHFTEEEANIAALEAIVELGTRLAASQPRPLAQTA